MSEILIDFSISEGTGVVTLQNQPVNAFNRELVDNLHRIIAEIEREQTLRCVILTGVGKYFSAGADLKERRTMNDGEVQAFINKIRTGFQRWYNLEIPTICAMNGGAYGGGLELALMCDFRIIADDAELGLKETRLGIIPGAGGTQRLSRLIGESNALKWILPGTTYTAEEALDDGVVTWSVPREDVATKAQEIAQEIQLAAPIAVKQAKKAIREGLELDYAAALEFETTCYNVTIPTRDRMEALNAFAEKRAPEWQGR